MSSLIYLELYNLFIEHIPPGIKKLSKLEQLVLNDSNLSELPLEIGKLKKLKVLVLGNTSYPLSPKNKIRKIPPTIGNLEKLSPLGFKPQSTN